MNIYVLYQPNSESERPAHDFARQLEQFQVKAQLIDTNSTEGTRLTELYDLLSRPAVVVIQNDGTLVQAWQHGLPSLDDVVNLAHT